MFLHGHSYISRNWFFSRIQFSSSKTKAYRSSFTTSIFCPMSTTRTFRWNTGSFQRDPLLSHAGTGSICESIAFQLMECWHKFFNMRHRILAESFDCHLKPIREMEDLDGDNWMFMHLLSNSFASHCVTNQVHTQDQKIPHRSKLYNRCSLEGRRNLEWAMSLAPDELVCRGAGESL